MDTGLKIQTAQRQLVSLSAFEGEFDVQAPVGFFYPLGLGKEGDATVFKLRRSVVGCIACLRSRATSHQGLLPSPFGTLPPSLGLSMIDVPMLGLCVNNWVLRSTHSTWTCRSLHLPLGAVWPYCSSSLMFSLSL